MAQSDLQRAMKRHIYTDRAGGPPLPSVTGVIGIMDKPALKWASSEIAARTALLNSRRRKRIAQEHRLALSKKRTEKDRTLAALGTDDDIYVHWCRGAFDREWRAKADRGNRVHDVAEAWSRGESVNVLDSDAGFVDALERFHTLYKPRFRLVECIVVNKYACYGGRFDAIADLDGPGAEGTYLIDYKTGSHYGLEVAMQMIAYWHAGQVAFDKDGMVAQIGPEIGGGDSDDWEEITNEGQLDGCRVIYLGEDGSLSVIDPFEKVAMADAWSAFTSALWLHRMTKTIQESLNNEEESE